MNVKFTISYTSYMRKQTASLYIFIILLTIHYTFNVYIYSILKFRITLALLKPVSDFRVLYVGVGNLIISNHVFC